MRSKVHGAPASPAGQNGAKSATAVAAERRYTHESADACLAGEINSDRGDRTSPIMSRSCRTRDDTVGRTG